MKINLKNKILALTATAVLGISQAAALPVSDADVPWLSYTYGIWGTSVPASPIYDVVKAVDGFDLGLDEMSGPDDLCKDNDNNINILDVGKKRIIKLNDSLEVIQVLNLETEKILASGVELVDPQGICYDKNGFLYIADKGAECVWKCNPDGTLIRKIVKPITELLSEEEKFAPTKLLVDNQGILYVLSFGSFEGAYTFDENGDFLGFFGSNKVSVTSQLLQDRIWRKLLTSTQRDRMSRYVPIEYVNFTIDEKGFIYTVSNFGEQEQDGQVKKLNPLSQNILFAGQKPDLQFFGDTENTYSNRVERSNLVAVDVDPEGFISVLDSERGRIFQYDQDCNLLGIFGGIGNQTGTFTSPTDIISSGDKIFVLDSVKNNLTMFKLTDYGKAIHQATYLYDEGFFEEALVPWNEALKFDRTNPLTLRGIGRAYERLERYKEAMSFYRQADAHRRYSDSYYEYRTEVLRKHFSLVMIVLIVILLIPLWKFIFRKIKPKKTGPVNHAVYIKKYRFPFYLCLHPFKGWEELKHEKQGSLWFANVMLAAWFILSILEYQYTGFVFNMNRLDRMNIFIILGSTIGVFLLWTVCNWGVCTLFDGKGTFREIWIFSAYSRMSWILLEIPIIILTRVLVREESFWLGLVISIQQIWSIVQLILAAKAAHQYTLGKTIVSTIFTIIGMILVVLVILLFVSLFTQMWSFITTLTQEILMRV